MEAESSERRRMEAASHGGRDCGWRLGGGGTDSGDDRSLFLVHILIACLAECTSSAGGAECTIVTARTRIAAAGSTCWCLCLDLTSCFIIIVALDLRSWIMLRSLVVTQLIHQTSHRK